MKYINLTPHRIRIVPIGFVNASLIELWDVWEERDKMDNPLILDLPPSGRLARLATETEVVKQYDAGADYDHMPISFTKFGEVEELPPPQFDVTYITSMLVAQKVRREDVLSPGREVRNEDGEIIACQGLTAWPPYREYRWVHTEDMGKIGGISDGYEKTCQDMLHAGVVWLRDNPMAQLVVTDFFSRPDNDDSRALFAELCRASQNGHSGSQIESVMDRLLYIHEKGWEKYCEYCREQHAKRQTDWDRYEDHVRGQKGEENA